MLKHYCYRATAVVLMAAAMLASMSSCTGKKEPKRQPIAKIACDESFENVMQQEIDVYEYVYPKEDVIAYYWPERQCRDSILAMTDIKNAVLTQPLTDQEVAYLKSHKKIVKQQRIAVDAIAIIVNPQNSVEILSKPELAEILSGKVERWDNVEPGAPKGRIQVVFDHQGSSTVAYMRDSVLHGKPFGPTISAAKTNREVFEAVAKNKNALGIIGVSWISSDLTSADLNSVAQLAQRSQQNDTTTILFHPDIKVLKIRGNNEVTAYRPYQANILDGTYPLYRSVWMVCTAPGGTSHRFFSFVTGVQGQKIIQMTGILPATIRPRMVEVTQHPAGQ